MFLRNVLCLITLIFDLSIAIPVSSINNILDLQYYLIKQDGDMSIYEQIESPLIKTLFEESDAITIGLMRDIETLTIKNLTHLLETAPYISGFINAVNSIRFVYNDFFVQLNHVTQTKLAPRSRENLHKTLSINWNSLLKRIYFNNAQHIPIHFFPVFYNWLQIIDQTIIHIKRLIDTLPLVHQNLTIELAEFSNEKLNYALKKYEDVVELKMYTTDEFKNLKNLEDRLMRIAVLYITFKNWVDTELSASIYLIQSGNTTMNDVRRKFEYVQLHWDRTEKLFSDYLETCIEKED